MNDFDELVSCTAGRLIVSFRIDKMSSDMVPRAPRQLVICCRTSMHPRLSSSARSTASTCPLMRRTPLRRWESLEAMQRRIDVSHKAGAYDIDYKKT